MNRVWAWVSVSFMTLNGGSSWVSASWESNGVIAQVSVMFWALTEREGEWEFNEMTTYTPRWISTLLPTSRLTVCTGWWPCARVMKAALLIFSHSLTPLAIGSMLIDGNTFGVIGCVGKLVEFSGRTTFDMLLWSGSTGWSLSVNDAQFSISRPVSRRGSSYIELISFSRSSWIGGRDRPATSLTAATTNPGINKPENCVILLMWNGTEVI